MQIEKPIHKMLDDADTMPLTTRLAFERTRGAYERTMMAWIRTAMSLITFGFSVYKFFNLDMADETKLQTFIGPREFGLVLISFGLLSLFLGTIEHRRDIKAMQKQYIDMPKSMTWLLSLCLAPLGLIALFIVIFRF